MIFVRIVHEISADDDGSEDGDDADDGDDDDIYIMMQCVSVCNEK